MTKTLNTYEIQRTTSSATSSTTPSGTEHYSTDKRRVIKRSGKRSTSKKEHIRLSNELERRKLESMWSPDCSPPVKCRCGCYEREQIYKNTIEFYQRIATFVVLGVVAKVVIDALSERK